MSRGDGGPAFPFAWSEGQCINDSRKTLRDYFAAKAMEGLKAKWPHWAPSVVAKESYEMADAMLAARQEETR